MARRQTSWSCCSAAKWWGAHCPNGHSSNSSDVPPRTFALVILSLNKEVDLRKMYGELIHSLVGTKSNQSPLEEKKHSQSKLDPKCQCKTSPESLITHWAFFIREKSMREVLTEPLPQGPARISCPGEMAFEERSNKIALGTPAISVRGCCRHRMHCCL